MNAFATTALKQFKYYENLGITTIGRLSDEQLNYQHNPSTNSIATIAIHLHGNMLSRWTDFLTTDGEKEWRKRDEEFEGKFINKTTLISKWNEGWVCLYKALDQITDKNEKDIVYIRNLGQTVQDAVMRLLCHYGYHVGQIVYIGMQLLGTEWESLSIPKNQSIAYNKAHFDKEKSIKHFTDK
jgi:hypothetical protein